MVLIFEITKSESFFFFRKIKKTLPVNFELFWNKRNILNMYNGRPFSFWYRNMWYFKDRQTVVGGEVDGANSSLHSFIKLFSFISDNCHPKGTWSPFIFNWYHIKRNFFFKKGTHWQSLVYSPKKYISHESVVISVSWYRGLEISLLMVWTFLWSSCSQGGCWILHKEKEFQNFIGYCPRKVYWKILHCKLWRISRNALTHDNSDNL